MNNFIFVLFTLIATLGYGGKNDSIPKFYKLGLILNGNIGIQNSGNYNFISSNSQIQGQDLLGTVGQSGELGLEFLFFFKNGLAIKGDIHNSRLFGTDSRGGQSQLDGNWFGSGKSIGIGYHALLRDSSSHFFLSSNLSFGSYTSKWTFSNNGSTGYPNFGNVVISPESQESFISNNYYLDINILAGFPLIKNKNVIGFVGAPWTLLVYMINKHSPKKELIKNFFKDGFLINRILTILEKFLKLRILNLSKYL